MGWKAIVCALYNLITQYQDGRDQNAIVVGADAGSPNVNSTTRIVLNPSQVITPNDWVGRHVIIRADSVNNMIGDTVAEEILDFQDPVYYLTAIDLSSPLPQIPVAGNQLDIFEIFGGVTGVSHSNLVVHQLEKEISDITFETNIDEGFGRCTVTLNDRSQHLSRLAADMIGKYLEIFDPYGSLAYAGLITSTSFSGSGGSIEATSVKSTLGWYYLTGINYEDRNSVYVLRQILATNPWFDYQQFAIDPMDDWGPNQTKDDWDWRDGDYTALDIIEDVLVKGYEGMPNFGDTVTIQVWADAVPQLKIFPRYPGMDDVTWLLSPQNFGQGLDGVSLEAGLSEVDSMMFTSYTDSEGETHRTPAAYIPHYLKRYGAKAEIYNVASQFPSVIIESLTHASKDRELIGRPGSIDISGNVKSASGDRCLAPYLIHAGDVVALEGQIGQAHSSVLQSRDEATGIFVIGSTSYTVSSGKLTITAKEPLAYRDLYSQKGDIGA